MSDIYLTGITTTGTPHIGNYVGAIRPGIAASRSTAWFGRGYANTVGLTSKYSIERTHGQR